MGVAGGGGSGGDGGGGGDADGGGGAGARGGAVQPWVYLRQGYGSDAGP